MDEIQGFFNFDDDSPRQKKVEKTDNKAINLSDQFIDNPIYFPPENEKGNIEYKLKISNPSHDRFEHLLTQMNWRIKEGDGEAIYRIGVADNGLVLGLNKYQADLSLKTIERMAKRINASMTVLNEISVTERGKTRKAYELSIKEIKNNDEILPELRVAVLGNTNCGKSSLISVLTQSILDDGNGRARMALGCRHRHEWISGHTSSISREIFGFTKSDNVINYSGEIRLKEFQNDEEDELKIKTDEDILNSSKVLVGLLDLPGNAKHLKSTAYGIIAANFAFLVVNATTSHLGTAKEHLSILLTLNLPFLIVLNKIDSANEIECSKLLHSLTSHLGNKTLHPINNTKDVQNYFSNTTSNVSTSALLLNNVPLIKCSCLTGQSISLIYHFVNRLINDAPIVFNSNLFNSFNTTEITNKIVQPFEFLIEDVFHQNEETCVLRGLLLNGRINKNELILIGPTSDGEFVESKIRSIQRYKVTMNCLKQSESGSLELELTSKENMTQTDDLSSISKDKIKIRKGMIIVSKDTNLNTITIGRMFEARLNVIYLKNPIRRGFQCKIYVDNIKQGVVLEQIEDGKIDEITGVGQHNVTLKFVKHLEVIRVGSNFFLHESTLKATGAIIESCSRK